MLFKLNYTILQNSINYIESNSMEFDSENNLHTEIIGEALNENSRQHLKSILESWKLEYLLDKCISRIFKLNYVPTELYNSK